MLIPEYYQRVAFTLRKFHSLKAPKIPKESLLRTIFFEGRDKIMKICHEKLRQDIYTK